MGLLDFLKRNPRKRQCARCGQRASHGYSQQAESDVNQIAPLCLTCLAEQLRQDYTNFRGRAVLVAPAAGLPCYVFREQTISSSLLRQIGVCAQCQTPARCLWIESRGLTIETFGNVLEEGPDQSLLTWGNPAPVSLCGVCAAKRISKSLQPDGFEFFEICSPHEQQEGTVLPMAY